MPDCEARTPNGPCRQPHARRVEFSRPLREGEPHSSGAIAVVIDPALCAHHRAQLQRWATDAARSATVLVTEVWGIER